MARKRKLESIKDYERALRNKYGKEVGENYKPWLRVSDVDSHGRSSIVHGIKSKRDHHFLSDIETRLFYFLEYSRYAVDIREQFPLFPLDLVMQTAKAAAIPYPYVPRTKTPSVVTTDFLVTLRSGGYLAIAVKPSDKLCDARVCEKLEIERLWWEQLGVKWILVTEFQVPVPTANNLRWASQPFRKDASLLTELREYTDELTEYVHQIDIGKYEISSVIETIAVDFDISGEPGIQIISATL
ncbi:MAG: TnsA endonuclease N-terminal domain-containing protein [Halopseudomonas sp.]